MRRTRPHLRRVVAAAVLPLALSGLAACSGGSGEGEPSGSAAPAGEGSGEEPAAEAPAEGEEVDGQEFLADLEAGFEEASTARFGMEMDAQGSPLTADGRVDYATNPPTMDVTLSMPSAGMERVQMVLVDGVMYLQLPQLGGGKFVRYDLSDRTSPMGDQLARQMDPRASFESLGKGLTSVTYLGEEDVAGEGLDKYELAVDTAKMDAQDAQGLPRQVDYLLWVDDEMLMRQLEVTVQGSTVTMTMSEWGEPVNIKAPAASKVVEMPETG